MASERVVSGFGLEETSGEESYFEDNRNRDESGSESGRDSDDDDENRKFNEMLIKAVRAKPLLYDKSLRDYKDGEKINLAWRKIGEELNFPAEKCKERWTNLRSSYSRNKRNRKKPSGSGAKGKKRNTTYKFEAQMSFIDKFMKLKKTQSNFESSSISTESTESPLVVSHVPGVSAKVNNGLLTLDFERPIGNFGSVPTADTQSNVSSLSFGDGAIDNPTASIRKRQKQDPVDDALLEYFKEKREHLNVNTRQQDDCDHFGLLIADELCRLDQVNRRNLRNQIVKVIDDFVLLNE